MPRAGDQPTLALALAASVVAVCACQTKPTQRRARKNARVSAGGGGNSAARSGSATAADVAARAPKSPQQGAASIAAAFAVVARGCEVSLAGRVTKASCRTAGAEIQLEAAETQLGSTAALLHYCAVLGADDHVARALASRRIEALAGTAKRAVRVANREVFDCFARLLPKLSAEYLSRHARRVAKAIGWFATALGSEATARAERVLSAHSNKKARRMGRQAIWKHSAASAQRALRAALAGQNVKLLQSIVKSLVQLAPDRANRAELCPLLGKSLARRDKDVAPYAARALVKHCGARYHASIIAAARAAATKRYHFGWNFSYALRDMADAKKDVERDPARVRRVVATLAMAVESRSLDSYGRKYALEALYEIDKKRALALARRYARAGCNPDVSEMACKLINKATR